MPCKTFVTIHFNLSITCLLNHFLSACAVHLAALFAMDKPFMTYPMFTKKMPISTRIMTMQSVKRVMLRNKFANFPVGTKTFQ